MFRFCFLEPLLQKVGLKSPPFLSLTSSLLLSKQIVCVFCCFGLWIPRALMLVEMAVAS